MRAIAGAIAALGLSLACAGSRAPDDAPPLPPAPAPGTAAGTRPFRMGFSVMPPRPDLGVAVQALDRWTPRADAAIMHLAVPWAKLLAGTPPDAILRADGVDLVRYYRGKGLTLFVTLDITDGLAREKEAPELVAAGRSIAEPAVRRLYVDYARAVVALLAPDYLGLAAETNLVRHAAPRAVYDAVVAMTNDAARALRAAPAPRPPALYVSVQVETAWGRLGGVGGGTFVGIEADRRDFPFAESLGLSSYPYLGGFADPERIPDDYYARLVAAWPVPAMVVEGGWPSASVAGVFTTSPAVQARYVARQAALAERARLIAVLPLMFTDLDLASFPGPQPAILPLFATLGVVDAGLRAKPALAAWDSVFARRLAR